MALRLLDAYCLAAIDGFALMMSKTMRDLYMGADQEERRKNPIYRRAASVSVVLCFGHLDDIWSVGSSASNL